ncbi:hypothetical protein ES705_05283 [subsurface metagenome]|nr:hypothetical protein [Clostridia bacterium]
MRKKFFIVLVISMLQFHSVAHAGVWQLLVGMGLMGGGLFMAVDGFSTVKKIDKEWDEKVIDREWYQTVKDKEWDWFSYEYHSEWYLALVKTWEVEYYYPDPDLNSIVSLWYIDDNYWIGDYWYYDFYGYNHHTTYKTQYYCTYKDEHFVTYKTETKSPTEGAIGIGSMALGTYMVIDYLVGLNKLKKKAGIEIKFAQQKDTSYLLCCKNF